MPARDPNTARRATRQSRPQADKHVWIVGLGNIGSFLVPLLARLDRVKRMTLVDFDSYSAANLVSQSIRQRDVGRAKASVQGRRVGEIEPRIGVRAVVRRIEDVAVGWPLPDVILGAVDSRAARVALNEVAWRLGVPLIDAGVNAEGSLVRLSTVVPSPGAACLVCAWDEADFAAVEQRYSCTSGETPATGAAAHLGAQVAAMQTAECERLLLGVDRAAREVILSTELDRYIVTPLLAARECRFDHRRLDIEPLAATPGSLRFADVFCLAGEPAEARLRVFGRTFVRALRCSACGARRDVLRLREELRPQDTHCAGCGSTMSFGGFDCADWIDRASLGAQARRSLRSAGVARGDVISIAAPGVERHFLLRGTDTAEDAGR